MNERIGNARTKPIRGTKLDAELRYATTLDPRMEQWRALASEWLATVRDGKHLAMDSLKLFLVDYIYAQQLETDPAKFFRCGYRAPCLYESCLKRFKRKKAVRDHYKRISLLAGYILANFFSVEDDDGHPVVPSEFGNPIPDLPEAVEGHGDGLQESDKRVLPYHLISQVRNILCPTDARTFADWKWVQVAEDSANRGGSWFVAPYELIDEADPDCVWRERETSSYERDKFGYAECVYEIWSPVRAVAMYVKLQLPLRTYQVRMLDSGEADTYRYMHGEWIRNTGPLAKGTEKNQYRRGIFRQMTDDIKHVSMTGLFVNTNKTADGGKEEGSKGYTIPWEHKEVLFWLEKLRNWQAKYNPISAPTAWTDLDVKHLRVSKSEASLLAMGSACFLFRDAVASGDDRSKPITSGMLDLLWHKLLQQLENQCLANNVRDAARNPLAFVKPNTNVTTYYPLHSLRVSLITAYALEGGVPMTILSKCIAGHARLVMTLYYTKAGITYCTETMDAATKRLIVTEQENYARWLKDKTYEQLEANGAFFDPAAIQAVMQATQNGVSLIKDDKGFCPKGGWGCDSGGVYVNDETGKVTYGEVPGYPQKNCPRCRWFFTGPAFLDGLHNHWNHIQLNMGDLGERIVKLEGQITSLEDELYECQANDRPFLEHDKLNTLRKIHQAEHEKNIKNAADCNATHRLIVRCKVISNEQHDDDSIRLVAVGSLHDVQIAINECDKLQQILTAVAGSAVYPEHDVTKAALQAGKAFDMMLARNGKEPVFFRLGEDELPVVVQHMTKLLATQAGSIKEALPFIEGTRRLAELGLDLDIEQLAHDMAAARVIQLAPAPGNEQPLLV
ncbi:VPA1269 family protein [Paraburkholderia sediminicola]|uniref:gamma-mobile-trio integrase GmtZ n=1 Tax=Paraburkholderia sediminicola TaxID=458836 RepID=UPI0038BD8995